MSSKSESETFCFRIFPHSGCRDESTFEIQKKKPGKTKVMTKFFSEVEAPFHSTSSKASCVIYKPKVFISNYFCSLEKVLGFYLLTIIY